MILAPINVSVQPLPDGTSLQVGWDFPNVPDSDGWDHVTITVSGPGNPPPITVPTPGGGVYPVTHLQLNSQYSIRVCSYGIPISEGSASIIGPECAAAITGTTKRVSGTTGSGGGQTVGGPTGQITPYPGAVTNVQALAKPFGKIVVSWSDTGWSADTLVLQRAQQINSFTFSGSVTVYQTSNYNSAGGTPAEGSIFSGTFVDTGPFVLGAVCQYTFISSIGQTKAYAGPPYITYPALFGLSKFLPPGFDPSQGIKRLRPSDHPTISVRSIMTGT
jgi:hypothetical protein